MTPLDAGHFKPLSESLLRLIGMNKWALDLQSNTMMLETGRSSETGETLRIRVDQLASLYTADDMKKVSEHWSHAAKNGIAGPDVLPFVGREGKKVQIESVAALQATADNTLLVGYYRVCEGDIKSHKRIRLLTEFLESFVHNSPSSIIVFDAQNKVINANGALGRFLNIPDPKTSLLGSAASDFAEIVDRKFAMVLNAALAHPGSSDGQHLLLDRTGSNHTIYWRCFSLSTQDETIKTRVFSFNHHRAGPMTKVA